MTDPRIHFRTEWFNGAPTYVVTVSGASITQQDEIEQIADSEGFQRDGDRWTPSGEAKLYKLLEALRATGIALELEPEHNGPYNLQRLHLTDFTRYRLERLHDFRIDELAGWCPVQAEGVFDGLHFYFRARGSYWRFEVGGNQIGTRGPSWWHEERWPGRTGFEAGYMSDEDAIQCIIKSVETYRTSDRSRFQKGHPEYERTTLEGWSLGALSLVRVTRRLGISGEEAIDKMRAYGLGVPYLAERELKALEVDPGTVRILDEMRGIWIDVAEEDD
ncbi:hypothetical protein ELH93_28560 (plasmid) [Rhizobium leguminosarum]|uniref:hypothetical protein n=1 Tax=Rhizobium leguminosarum TaxID=384 RepID=UPI00102F4E39|nr:hypothetical protein [Rhizobium leguminosarum]TAY27682.1 hypothetical protein ELH93_28560 [Rhizobium leguminosarum]